MKTRIEIRQATPADLKEILEVFKAAIHHTCQGEYSVSQRKAWAAGSENLDRWQLALREQYFLVALFQDEIAGFGSLRDGHYLDFLFTNPKYNKLGVATKIFQDLEEKAMSYHTEELTSDVSFTARPFFERMGFQAVHMNNMEIRGVPIANFRMKKPLHYAPE